VDVSYSLFTSKNGNEPTAPQQEAEGFIKAALDALTENIAILDEQGIIIHVNKAWRDFGEANGFGAGYSLGTNYLTVCDNSTDHVPDANLVAQGIRVILSRESDEFYLEYPCHSLTQRRWYVVRVTSFQWYGQIRLILTHQNITAVKQAQVDLEESKQRLEAILENLVDGIITFDEHGTIETLNSAGATIFGYDREEIIGQNISMLVPALNQPGMDDSVVDFITRLGGLGDELDGRHKDGSIFPMYFAVSQLSLGEKRLFTAIIQDFTERKYLEAQMWDKERLNTALDKERELRDLKNRFISMMSHELRTPLAAIKLANSMLQMYGEQSSEEEKWESYETIDQQVEYLTELVSDVMTISKTDFTGAEFEAESVDLETYCRDVIEHIMLAYQMKRGIEFIGVNKRVEARVDTKLLHRALTNLLTNAIKYSPDDKSIVVTLTVSDQFEAIIRVSDQGIGIPEEDLPRLFEPFHRAANVGKIHGTGLGLAIAKQAIELHGGRIAVESKVGIGTTFTISLPVLVDNSC
jgi:PAS domain S-box-containing protein